MNNLIANNVFTASNKKLTIGLIILILLLVISGSVGLYSFYNSNKKTIYYYNAVKDVKDIEKMYQTQINIWRNMILNKDNVSNFSRNYYEFSKQTERIQDSLFNLKIKFLSEQDNIGEKIDKMRLFHQKITDRYVSLVFENLTPYLSQNPAVAMKEDEERALDDLERIVASVTALADKKIGNSTEPYFFMAISFFVILTAIFFILILMIITERRKAHID
jgi:hypothetical protein